MRDVKAVPGFEIEISKQAKALSPECARAVYFFSRSLATEDPELPSEDEEGDFCGTIAMRYEVFDAAIPGCRSHRLALTIDRNAPEAVYVHAIRKGGAKASGEAYRLASTQLNLGGEPWEPL